MNAFVVFDLIIVALFVGMGVGSMMVARRQMRRGQVVTPQEIEKVQRAFRKRGVEFSSDVAELQLLAARIQRIWLRFGLGAGVLLAGVLACVSLFVSGPDSSNLPFLAVLGGSTIALYIGAVIGLLIGFSRMRRDPDPPDAQQKFQRLWDYCSPFAIILPWLVVTINLVLMVVLVNRLASHLNDGVWTHVFALPGMWTALAEPGALLMMLIATMLLIWRFGAFPLFYLPRGAEVRQRADNAMRSVAIWQMVAIFVLVAIELGFVQFLLLASGVYPNVPLYTARLEGWYLIYLGLLLIIALVALVRVRIRRIVRITTEENRSTNPVEAP